MNSGEPVKDFSGLVNWLLELKLQDVPDTVVQDAKKCLLDGLTCLTAGSYTTTMDEYREVIKINSAKQYGGVPIGRIHAGVLDAANFYAQSSNILDLDDCYRAAPSHPGATIIGPALACAYNMKSSGDQLLLAIIKAYEGSLRIGASLCPSDAAPSKDIGYASWQTFGAYIAAGSLIGLTYHQWIQGFGLTAQQSPMPMIVRVNPEGNYTWLKNTYGIAAQAGVASAFLAQRGYIGDQHFFSDKFGFWKVYGSDQFRPQMLVTLPGTDWLITGVEFKPWACCRWAHPAIEAVLVMKEKINPQSIQSIDIYAFEEFCETLDSPWPTNLINAQFSARLLVSEALLCEDFDEALREPKLDDPLIKEMYNKVHIHHDSECDEKRLEDMAIPTRVVIRTSDSVQERFISEPPGSAKRGIADMAETETKFKKNLSSIMSQKSVRRMCQLVRNIENEDPCKLLDLAFRIL